MHGAVILHRSLITRQHKHCISISATKAAAKIVQKSGPESSRDALYCTRAACVTAVHICSQSPASQWHISLLKHSPLLQVQYVTSAHKLCR